MKKIKKKKKKNPENLPYLGNITYGYQGEYLRIDPHAS